MPRSLADTKLAQVAFVVKDIKASAERWASLLGVDVPEIVTTLPGLSVGQLVDGEPSDAQCHLAFFNLGGVQLELIQPLGGASSWQQGLDEKGEGFHHIAFATKNMKASEEILAEHDAPLWHIGGMGGGGLFAYFKSQEGLGATIELLQHGPAE